MRSASTDARQAAARRSEGGPAPRRPVRRVPGGALGARRVRVARRRSGCGGRRCAPTSLRCSPLGRAAKLAARAALAPLGQSPRVRGTKRASRTAPEAALLGAAEVAPPRNPYAACAQRAARRAPHRTPGRRPALAAARCRLPLDGDGLSCGLPLGCAGAGCCPPRERVESAANARLPRISINASAGTGDIVRFARISAGGTLRFVENARVPPISACAEDASARAGRASACPLNASGGLATRRRAPAPLLRTARAFARVGFTS